MQGTARADRPLCAAMAAFAAALDQRKVGGELRGADEDTKVALFTSWLEGEGVGVMRAIKWALSINGQHTLRPAPDPLPQIQGLTLSQYQLDTIYRTPIGGGVHALSCGLGKTLTAVGACITAVRIGMAEPSRCWIVCPLNAIPAWQRVVPDLEQVFEDVQILSMDSAHKYAHLDRAAGGCVIYDEVHLLGSASARRTKACHTLRPAFTFGLCLTGTLLHAGIEKTMSILDLAVPGGALFSDRWGMGRHFDCIVRKQLGARTVSSLAKPASRRRQEFFHYLSRLVQVLKFEHPAVMAEVGEIRQTTHTIAFGEPFTPVHERAIALAQAYFDEHLVYPDGAWVRMALLADAEGVPSKVAWCVDLLESNDDPVIIFDFFRENLDLVQAALEEAGISFVRVDGDVTGKQRDECERTFNAGEVRVFLGQTHAAGISMNLQRASTSIMVSPSQSAPAYEQAQRRTARRGQTKHCHHYDLVSNELQLRVFRGLREGKNFDAESADWQIINAATKGIPCQ